MCFCCLCLSNFSKIAPNFSRTTRIMRDPARRAPPTRPSRRFCQGPARLGRDDAASFSGRGVSIPSLDRDRRLSRSTLPHGLRMQRLMAIFADRDKLTLSCVRVPDAQREIRTVSQMLDVMHDHPCSCCAGTNLSLRFAELTLAVVQAKNRGPQLSPPLVPGVKLIFAAFSEKLPKLRKTSCADHCVSPPGKTKIARTVDDFHQSISSGDNALALGMRFSSCAGTACSTAGSPRVAWSAKSSFA